MVNPDWLIEVAIEAASAAERDKLDAVLGLLAADIFALGVTIERASGQIIFRGMGEPPLDNAIGRLRHHGIDIVIGRSRVAYREKITRPAAAEYIYKKQSGGSGQFAGVKITVDPLPLEGGFVIENRIVDGAVPDEYIPAIEKGLESAAAMGVLAGFPVVGLKVGLVGGKYHDTDSSALAFETAARMALREGLERCAPVLLEPIVAVEVMTPADNRAEVIHDMELRGQIQEQGLHGNDVVVRATAALANMLGYVHVLRRLTRDRGTFSMRFHHYGPVPPSGDPSFRPAMGMRP